MVLIKSSWNWQWLAAQQPLPGQNTLASFHHLKSIAPRPSPPTMVNKTPIRVNPLVYSLSDEYSNSIADELEHIC
jgi:hypothetical protein